MAVSYLITELWTMEKLVVRGRGMVLVILLKDTRSFHLFNLLLGLEPSNTYCNYSSGRFRQDS